MSKFGYSVWEEGGLYYWTVHFRGDHVCARGAATDLIRARAEAIAFGFELAIEDVARLAVPRKGAASTSHIR